MRPDAPRVVVGVRDSKNSQWALAGAIGEARLRGLPLLLVHVVPPVQPMGALGATLGGGWAELMAASRARGAALLCRMLDEVAGGVPPDLPVRALSMVGDPGRVLVELARPGDVLVLGRGSRRRFRLPLRPSARRYCTRYVRTTLVCVSPPSVDSLIGSLVPAASPRRRRWRVRSSES